MSDHLAHVGLHSICFSTLHPMTQDLASMEKKVCDGVPIGYIRGIITLRLTFFLAHQGLRIEIYTSPSACYRTGVNETHSLYFILWESWENYPVKTTLEITPACHDLSCCNHHHHHLLSVTSEALGSLAEHRDMYQANCCDASSRGGRKGHAIMMDCNIEDYEQYRLG